MLLFPPKLRAFCKFTDSYVSKVLQHHFLPTQCMHLHSEAHRYASQSLRIIRLLPYRVRKLRRMSAQLQCLLYSNPSVTPVNPAYTPSLEFPVRRRLTLVLIRTCLCCTDEPTSDFAAIGRMTILRRATRRPELCN